MAQKYYMADSRKYNKSTSILYWSTFMYLPPLKNTYILLKGRKAGYSEHDLEAISGSEVSLLPPVSLTFFCSSVVDSPPRRTCFDWGCFRGLWKKRGGRGILQKKNISHMSQWVRPHSGIDRLSAWLIIRANIQYFSNSLYMFFVFFVFFADKINWALRSNELLCLDAASSLYL